MFSNDHINNNQGCPNCNFDTRRLSVNEFVKRANLIHNNQYDYSKVNYENMNTRIIIICSKHGEFKQTPSNHLGNHGCSKCVHHISKTESMWLNEIEKINNIIIERNPTIYINNQRFHPDGFHKESNTWYEYNGFYWHGHPDYYNQRDLHPVMKITYGELYSRTIKKEELIKQAGYNLIVKWGY